MKILDSHIRNALLGMCLVVALALTGISGFVTLVEELDDLGQGQYNLALVSLVTLLKMPEVLYDMFPLIVLLGAILGLGSLAAGGELVVMQAAGISVIRIAWSAGKAGFMLGLVVLFIGEILVPRALQVAESISTTARFGEGRVHSKAVWLRQGEQFIRIDRLQDDTTVLDVHTLTVNKNDSKLVRTQAMDQAHFKSGIWHAQNLRTTDLDYGSVQIHQRAEAEWLVDLDPDVLQLFVLKSDSLSLNGLYKYIAYLDSNGLDSTTPQYTFWRKLAAPLTVLVMVLLAVPFVLGPLRDTGAGQRLFIGVMIGIGFYVLNEVSSSLGQVYGWSAPIAALTPTLLLLVIALWRLQRRIFD